MGNSLLAVVSTRRPGQDSVSANAELVRWTRIRPWPSPWSTRTRFHRSRRIAGSRRSCGLWRHAPSSIRCAARQPRSPCLEGRPALHFREKDAGRLIKTGAGKSVPAFRYPALPIRFSGLIPSRRQSEIGTDIPSPLEPVRLIDRGAECKGCYRPDARHRHEPSQRQVVADKTTDLLVQSRHLSNGNLPHFDQFVDERRQDRMVLGEHPRALGESTFVAASYDQAKGLQDTADLTIDLDAHIDDPTANP